MLNDDLVVGDDDAFDHQPQDALLERKGGRGQLGLELLTKGGDRLGQRRGLLGLGQLCRQHLLPLLHLLPRLPQPLPALFEFIQFQGPHLVGIEQTLLLARQRRALAPQALDLPLGIGEFWSLPLALLA
jgi:hypothetical protein